MKKYYRVNIEFNAKQNDHYGVSINKVISVDKEEELANVLKRLKTPYLEDYILVKETATACELEELIHWQELVLKSRIIYDYMITHKELFDEKTIRDASNMKRGFHDDVYYDAICWMDDKLYKEYGMR